jgi:hypothetical protein
MSDTKEGWEEYVKARSAKVEKRLREQVLPKREADPEAANSFERSWKQEPSVF